MVDEVEEGVEAEAEEGHRSLPIQSVRQVRRLNQSAIKITPFSR